MLGYGVSRFAFRFYGAVLWFSNSTGDMYIHRYIYIHIRIYVRFWMSVYKVL